MQIDSPNLEKEMEKSDNKSLGEAITTQMLCGDRTFRLKVFHVPYCVK